MSISFNSAIPPYPQTERFSHKTKEEFLATSKQHHTDLYTWSDYLKENESTALRIKTKRASIIRDESAKLLKEDKLSTANSVNMIKKMQQDRGLLEAGPNKSYFRYVNKLADIMSKNPPEVAREKLIGFITKVAENLPKR